VLNCTTAGGCNCFLCGRRHTSLLRPWSCAGHCGDIFVVFETEIAFAEALTTTAAKDKQQTSDRFRTFWRP
jgi:hypothetical protein